MAEAGAGDGGAAAAAAAVVAAGAGAAKPWHDGVAPEVVGFWQNKGLDLADPVKFATGFTEQYRQMEAFRGVPASEILRMVKPDSPEADVKAFWGKLGAPADPKEYDFSAIKTADGKEIAPELADALRASFARRFVPKDTAAEIAKDVIKFNEGEASKKTAEKTANIEVERAQLKSDWKQDYEANLYVAKQGAKALGFTAEQVNELENLIGYKGIMTALHRVGSLGKEANFISGGGATGGAMTREQATARKADIMQDKAWVARYHNGDTAARAEMLNLNRIITGDFESAA
jgi:hypothetical protein